MESARIQALEEELASCLARGEATLISAEQASQVRSFGRMPCTSDADIAVTPAALWVL